MVVVSDTSPIWVLSVLGHIELLRTLFGRIVIPSAVESELADPKRPLAVQEFIAKPPAWLEMRDSEVIEPIPGLHPGEQAAIALAKEIQPDRILLDERNAREAAARRNLRVTGVVGVLKASAQRNLIDLEQTFEDLKKTDFWISHKFLDKELPLFKAWERQQGQNH